MQSQPECGQRKSIKFQIKKRVSKEEDKQQLKQGFINSLKDGEVRWKFWLEKLWRFSVFGIVKIGFRNHELIKIIMICMYIKPEVKKDDAAAMTTAINEAWELGESESCYLVKEIFLVREWAIFCWWTGFSRIRRVSHKVLGKGQRSPCLVRATSKIKWGGTFLERRGYRD